MLELQVIPISDKQELKKTMQTYLRTHQVKELSSLPYLMQVNPKKAMKFKKIFNQASLASKLSLVTQIPSNLAKKDHYIVVLGYALDEHGEMQQPLLQRLYTTLQLAKAYPTAKIVVSGGAAVQQRTEAQMMQAWLMQHQVSAERIILENHSTNTRENALYTLLQLSNQKVSELTLVTSASHLRRAVFIFEQTRNNLSEFKKLNFKFAHVASVDQLSALTQLSKVEEWLIFEDALRMQNHWENED